MATRPSFLLNLTFADLAGWWLRLECCGRTVCLPFAFLAAQKPRGRLGALLHTLRCRTCGSKPGRAVLVDDAAEGAHGRIALPGWRIEIVIPDGG